MRLRGASVRDFHIIEDLYKQEGCSLDVNHIERLMVLEDENGVVFAVGALTSGIEAAFLVDRKRSRRSRVLALTALLAQCNKEVKALGHNNFCVYATNDTIIKILKRKFGFFKTAAKQVLIKAVP